MKGNHKGFTLIELLVAIAILGILAVAEVTFMSTGSGLYRSVFGNVSLQTESQAAMNQLENAVINCSGGLCFDSDTQTLYVVDSDGAQYTEYIFEFDAGKNEIDYSRFIIPPGGTKPPSPTESGLMASHTESLNVTPNSADSVAYVTISARFSEASATCSEDKTVSLRNPAIWSVSEADLIGNVCK